MPLILNVLMVYMTSSYEQRGVKNHQQYCRFKQKLEVGNK